MDVHSTFHPHSPLLMCFARDFRKVKEATLAIDKTAGLPKGGARDVSTVEALENRWGGKGFTGGDGVSFCLISGSGE